MRFSIIVVCLNPGEKLNQTMESILTQTCQDFEVIVKDGGSRDGSVEALKSKTGILEDQRIRIFVEKDSGIYDAMNQAVSHVQGEFILFMNCGDVFFDKEVLEKIEQYIREEVRDDTIQATQTAQTAQAAQTAQTTQAAQTAQTTQAAQTAQTTQTAQAAKTIKTTKAVGTAQEVQTTRKPLDNLILYGNTYSEKNNVIIASPPRITGFTCYRNIPCHQSCVYAARLCKEKPYDLQYKIRADYDHFLWCYYVAGAKMTAMDLTVASYEGGGFSENKKNLKLDKQEHKKITAAYMKKGELFKYQLLLWCTLAPLRRWLAESPVFSSVYHRIKEKIYHDGLQHC